MLSIFRNKAHPRIHTIIDGHSQRLSCIYVCTLCTIKPIPVYFLRCISLLKNETFCTNIEREKNSIEKRENKSLGCTQNDFPRSFFLCCSFFERYAQDASRMCLLFLYKLSYSRTYRKLSKLFLTRFTCIAIYFPLTRLTSEARRIVLHYFSDIFQEFPTYIHNLKPLERSYKHFFYVIVTFSTLCRETT